MVDREVDVAVAATAAVLSPRVRGVLRKGVVYGVAGVMKAGDVVVSTAKGAAEGAQGGAHGSGDSEPPPATAGRSRAATAKSS